MTRPTRLRSELTPEQVRTLLDAGPSLHLVRALGLTTERGGASADAHRKLKQVTHFLRQLEAPVADVLARYPAPVIVDAAAGKSYLGLATYDVLLRPADRGRLVAIETRPDLTERLRNIVAGQKYQRVLVEQSTIAAAALPERIHLLMALHACDTATDEAIVRGIRAKADYIAVVPCCQAEVARQLAELPRASGWALLWDHPLHRREFAALLTNAVRASVLRSLGYEVTVTELAGSEHSPKNELILARRVARFHAGERSRLQALLAELPVAPALVVALGDLLTPSPAPSREAPPHSGEPATEAVTTSSGGESASDA